MRDRHIGLSHNHAVSEARVIRGSRTRSMPVGTSCRNRVRLIRNNFRNARWDQPSVTLALMPSAPKSETNSTLRPTQALSNLIDRFVAGQVQQLRIILRKPRT